MMEKRDLFAFMQGRVDDTASETALCAPQAFVRWFINMYYAKPQDVMSSDGPYDGKVDASFSTNDGREVKYHVVNAKHTYSYNSLAPAQFYEEVAYFWQVFENKANRADYLAHQVRPDLRGRYERLLRAYDESRAELVFLTNHRRNDPRYRQVSKLPVKFIHLDELIQHVVDDIDGAMPRTAPLVLTGIQSVLSPDSKDTKVPTSIVFAKLTDFISYMKEDENGLLFARNVRVPIPLKKSAVNRAIRDTYRDEPGEFAFSSNGITILCEDHRHDPGSKELTLDNPRVVNGSQTLHSIYGVDGGSANARVMVRIIEIEPPKGDETTAKASARRDVIDKIALRSNQQNPIKKWQLVSNDDFQLGLYRFFRQRDVFYERRDGEWQDRKNPLKSVGISKGPAIKRMAQLIASYYPAKKGLGPANAKFSVGQLFESEPYARIRETPAELAFQLYLVDENMKECMRALSASKAYIKGLRGHIVLALFTVMSQGLRDAGAAWNAPALTAELQGQWRDGWREHEKAWRELVKECVDHIFAQYKKQAKALGFKPTYNNFFKSDKYLKPLLEARRPRRLRTLARKVLARN